MDSPDLSVWLIAAYALIMLAAAWAVDVLGSRSARHSMSWRHSDFMYHDDVEGGGPQPLVLVAPPAVDVVVVHEVRVPPGHGVPGAA